MPTISKSVTVEDGGVYTVHLNIIPDGSTVTPVNDIQTWLHCGDIWDKDYTTLDQVLGDNTVLLTLISSNNAADYMARSTDWANINIVPHMTSNTAPSGVASASSEYSANYPAYRAFQGKREIYDAACWIASGQTGWIEYDFPQPVSVKKFIIQNRYYTAGPYPIKDFNIQAYVDGQWVAINNNSFTNPSSAVDGSYTGIIPGTVSKYAKWRLNYTSVYDTTNKRGALGSLRLYALENGICDNAKAMGYIGNNDYCANKLLSNAIWRQAICESDYFESVLTTKVPVMTSNTAPSGIASMKGGSANAYKGFDGNNADAAPAITNATLPAWLQYEFPSAVTIYKHVVDASNYSNNLSYLHKTFKISGSNDGTNFTDITSPYTFPTYGRKVVTDIEEPSAYKYYRYNVTAFSTDNPKNVYFAEHQFYGR